MTNNTGSAEPFKRMMEDYYRGAASIPWHVPYIPLQMVDAKQWGRDIGKSELKQNYLEHLRDALNKAADEDNHNG